MWVFYATRPQNSCGFKSLPKVHNLVDSCRFLLKGMDFAVLKIALHNQYFDCMTFIWFYCAVSIAVPNLGMQWKADGSSSVSIAVRN